MRKATEHTLIHTDCLNVAKTLDSYILHGYTEGKAPAETDLWRQIHHHIDNTARNLIRIKWIPSHLDEESKAATKRKHIKAGDCTEEDVLGNVEADKHANLGRQQHEDISMLLQLSEDRVNVTTLVQKK